MTRYRRARVAAPLALAILAAACGGPGPTSPATSPTGSGAPPAGPAGSAVVGGPRAVEDPAAGLGSLPAYRASLSVSFAGTQAGQPASWSQEYSLTSIAASRVRMLAYTQAGLGNAPAPYAALEGHAGTVHYLRRATGEPCTGAFLEAGADPAAFIEPASLLPRIRTLTAAGAAQQVAGMTAEPFTFDAAAVVTGGSGQAAGRILLVRDSHLVLSLDLQLTGGADVFDADTQGTMTWAYRLEPIDPAGASAVPADCPTPLPEIPLMANAANVLRFPGYLSYETTSDVAAVADFYGKQMPGVGFSAVGDPYVSALAASLAWTKGSDAVRISVAIGTPTTVRITRQAGKDAPNPSPAPQPTTPGQAGMLRVVKSLTLLLGSDATPSVFPSYHLELATSSPYWAATKVAIEKSAISADVAGRNVHFTSRDTKAGRTTTSEIYTIDGKSYAVVKGKVTEGADMEALAWTMWPLDVVVALGIGSFGTTPGGTATLDGRTAEVYAIEGSLADDTTGMWSSFGFPITSARGTVWVDQATGGLLKVVVDYQTDVKEGTVRKGSGAGHIEVVVGRVGTVSVALP